MKLVQYKDGNKIWDAILLFSDDNALLYLPPIESDECHCFVMANLDVDGYFKTAKTNYINYEFDNDSDNNNLVNQIINTAMKVYPTNYIKIKQIKDKIKELQQELEELENGS